MAFRVHVGCLVGLIVALAGCGSFSETSTVICPTPTQTKVWLLSEVGEDFETDPNSSFQFPFVNGLGHPVSLRVRSIGCSCYQLQRAGVRLNVGDEFEIATAATETLSLHASRPTSDRVADFKFSVEFDQKPGEPKQIIAGQGTLVSVSDWRVNPTLLTAEFAEGTSNQEVRLEVTRTARQREAAEQTPVLSGWPPGATVEAPRALEVATQVNHGLWRRSWRITAQIPPPEKVSAAEEFWPIRVVDGQPASSSGLARLMVRSRTGLSGPRIVHFGEVPAGQPVTRRIQILARDDRPFRILGLVEAGTPLSIQPESSDASKMHWGNLTFTPATTGDFREVLQITTDHPAHASLEIEVRAHVLAENSASTGK